VRVALRATEEEIWVEVTDDGVGFDPRATTEGVGLSAMRVRTAALSARLEVFSELGQGTRVHLRVPRPS
jgi:signal transduction histidine kinase